MTFTDYNSLPDSLESDELRTYFEEYIRIYKDKPKTLDALKELYELAYRQWDTYELLDKDISHTLEEYLISAINLRSHDIMDVILSIVENLSLKNAFDHIISCKPQVTVPSVARLIEEAEEEYSDSIGNPYSDDFDW